MSPHDTSSTTVFALDLQRCPYPTCSARSSPESLFYYRWGKFVTPGKAEAIQRYRCRTCRRTFSSQTTSYDRLQKRPELDLVLFQGFVSGMGIRQMARLYKTSRDVVADKLARISRRCRGFHDEIAQGLSKIKKLSFDELETFELCRVTMPVTMGTLIDVDSMFIIEQGNGPISARGNLSKRNKKIQQRQILRYGDRPHDSRACVKRIFSRGIARMTADVRFDFVTDKKTTYKPLATEVFGARLRVHEQYSSSMLRRPGAPMHRINLTHAMWRDNLGRLHRRSWLASKSRDWLDVHAWLFVVYRNYIRPRFNGEEETPAQRLAVLEARLDFDDILKWEAPPSLRP